MASATDYSGRLIAPRWVTRCLLLGSFALLCASPMATAKTPPQPEHRVALLAWLAGEWVSERDGSFAQEVWSSPRAGGMVGMFRLVNGKSLAFSELMTLSDITVRGSSRIELAIRHFNGRFQPLELEPLRYVSVDVGPNTAVFSNPRDDVRRLEFTRGARNGVATLRIRLVRLKAGKKTYQDFEFTHRRTTRPN